MCLNLAVNAALAFKLLTFYVIHRPEHNLRYLQYYNCKEIRFPQAVESLKRDSSLQAMSTDVINLNL